MTYGTPSLPAATVPSRWRYLFAALLFAAGSIAMAAILVVQLPKVIEGFQRLVVPGQAELTFGPGDHTVYLELVSVVDGEIFHVESVSDLKILVLSPLQEPLPFASAATSSSYTIGGRHGVSSTSFVVPEEGAYLVRGQYPEGVEGPRTVVAIAGPDDGMARVILPALGVLFLFAALAAWLAISTWRRRKAARVVATRAA